MFFFVNFAESFHQMKSNNFNINLEAKKCYKRMWKQAGMFLNYVTILMKFCGCLIKMFHKRKAKYLNSHKQVSI